MKWFVRSSTVSLPVSTHFATNCTAWSIGVIYRDTEAGATRNMPYHTPHTIRNWRENQEITEEINILNTSK